MTEPRRPNNTTQERYRASYQLVAAASADVNVKFDKLDARMKVTSVQLINPTGLAEHATAVVVVSLKNGSTVIASWSTDSDLLVADASIPVNTFLDLTLNTDVTTRVVASGDVLSFDVDVTGGTLPALTILVVKGVYF